MNDGDKLPYKRFMLFAFDDYEAAGGLNDCASSYDTLEEAMGEATRRNKPYESGRQNRLIFDRIEGVEVWSN